ncbi:dynein regulatory complex subunit 5 [Lagopus leucura]|uniref:dynein regulatory complex subunit 5 n=1 Tax=Lagopus leucura TaxID=30410 RepID=UPI001C682C57|nr:dynein regulatory complex subunit 5 [Lagopus leucura]XP_042750946.1 dynein regulatory complex subunit 5 [Lagopus leucura]
MQQAAGGRGRAIPSLRPSQSRLMADSYCMHRIVEDPEWCLITVPPLTELCLQHIVQNFTNNPVLDRLPPEDQRKVLARLPTGLPLTVTANLVSDEGYWKRCCTDRWQVCDVSNHGGSWKRMFFERHLENILKCFVPNTTDPDQVLELIPLCRDYVQKLEVDQFLPPVQEDQKEETDDLSDSGSDLGFGEVCIHHYDLGALVPALPLLEELNLTYGVKDCGMNFEWNLFKFTYQDCCNLAAAVKMCHNLKIFKLTRSNVDDDKTRLLVRNLLDHPSLVELDLSHNLIRDKGARAVSKLINCSKLEILHLCNNQICNEGAQALAQALAKNCTLTSLNLRLNHVEDEGGEAMGCALLTNTTLKSLHLGGNSLAEPTAVVFSQVLTHNSTLTCINFSCNPIGPDGGKQLLEGLRCNQTLTEFDLRLAEVGEESEYLISQMLWANRDAARLQPLLQQPAEPL